MIPAILANVCGLPRQMSDTSGQLSMGQHCLNCGPSSKPNRTGASLPQATPWQLYSMSDDCHGASAIASDPSPWPSAMLLPLPSVVCALLACWSSSWQSELSWFSIQLKRLSLSLSRRRISSYQTANNQNQNNLGPAQLSHPHMLTKSASQASPN